MTTTYTGEIKTVIPNKYVACKPYKTTENKGSVFSSWELKNPLIELEVVFQDKEKEYIPGSLIYVRPFLEPPSWIKDVFTLNNQEIILVPKDFIVGYKYVEETKVATLPQWQDYVKWPPMYGPYTVADTKSYTITWTASDVVGCTHSLGIMNPIDTGVSKYFDSAQVIATAMTTSTLVKKDV